VRYFDDGRLIAWRWAGGMPSALDVYDTETPGLVYRDGAWKGGRPIFLPGSHRLLAVERLSEQVTVLEMPRGRRLALLTTPNRRAATPALASDDGRWIATHHAGTSGNPTERLAVYHPAGWDCPPAAAGALAFPQLWGVILCFVAAGFSLFADARRGRYVPKEWPVSVLVIVASVLTLYALLDACFGRSTLWPAPILLISSLGWLTGARFWRFSTITLLSCALAMALYLASRLRAAGLGTGDFITWTVLDRPHAIPSLLALIALGVAAALAAAGLLLLAPRLQRP
jgi:hypothetical protein